MRRSMPIAAFALFLALPVWAQRGAGHAVGGHGGGFAGHSGFSGSRGGSFSGARPGGGHFSGGMRFSPGASHVFRHPSSFSRRSFSQRSFSHQSFFHDGFRGHRFHRHGFRNNCWGYGCSSYYYPWAYGGFYDPYWWWDSGSSYDEDYERDRATANEMNRQSLEEQEMRRQEEGDGNRDVYEHSDSAARPAPGDQQQGAAIM